MVLPAEKRKCALFNVHYREGGYELWMLYVSFTFPSPDFENWGGRDFILFCKCFLFLLVGWSNIDSHWFLTIFNYLSFSFPLASPPSTSVSLSYSKIHINGQAAPRLKPQDNSILRKAKLCASLNWVPPRWKPWVFSKAVSWRERREEIIERRDSPHSRSDRLLQARV